nr:hypothetical protein [Ningiella sp. W23]
MRSFSPDTPSANGDMPDKTEVLKFLKNIYELLIATYFLPMLLF